MKCLSKYCYTVIGQCINDIYPGVNLTVLSGVWDSWPHLVVRSFWDNLPFWYGFINVHVMFMVLDGVNLNIACWRSNRILKIF